MTLEDPGGRTCFAKVPDRLRIITQQVHAAQFEGFHCCDHYTSRRPQRVFPDDTVGSRRNGGAGRCRGAASGQHSTRRQSSDCADLLS